MVRPQVRSAATNPGPMASRTLRFLCVRTGDTAFTLVTTGPCRIVLSDKYMAQI